MKLGYARVSTTDQDLSIQRDRLYEAGCEKLLEEKTSGVRKKRPALERLLTELRPMTSLSSLAWTALHAPRPSCCALRKLSGRNTLEFSHLPSPGPIRQRRAGAWCSPSLLALRSSSAR